MDEEENLMQPGVSSEYLEPVPEPSAPNPDQANALVAV